MLPAMPECLPESRTAGRLGSIGPTPASEGRRTGPHGAHASAPAPPGRLARGEHCAPDARADAELSCAAAEQPRGPGVDGAEPGLGRIFGGWGAKGGAADIVWNLGRAVRGPSCPSRRGEARSRLEDTRYTGPESCVK